MLGNWSGHGIGIPLPIQQSGKILSKSYWTSNAQSGRVPSCWKKTFGWQCSSCGISKSCSIFSYKTAVTVLSVKKKGSMISFLISPHQTFNFGLSLMFRNNMRLFRIPDSDVMFVHFSWDMKCCFIWKADFTKEVLIPVVCSSISIAKL